jgi:hypothetical protein
MSETSKFYAQHDTTQHKTTHIERIQLLEFFQKVPQIWQI